jgi:hypothetical protein
VPTGWSHRVVANISDPEKWAWCADRAAIAVAVALPWSTTATLALIAIWLVMRIPMRDFAALRCEILTPAGGLPVALCAMGMLGVLWSDAPVAERVNGLSSYYKLLAIPLLLAQFRCFEPGKVRRTECGTWVVAGFLISCTILLLVSWGLVLLPDLPWRGRNPDIVGVPVKDRITQSSLFVLCAFGLIESAFDARGNMRRALTFGTLLLALGFLANVLFVATSRTALVLIPVLLFLFGVRRFGWYGLAGAAVAIVLLGTTAWQASPRVAATRHRRAAGSARLSAQRASHEHRRAAGVLAQINYVRRHCAIAWSWHQFHSRAVPSLGRRAARHGGPNLAQSAQPVVCGGDRDRSRRRRRVGWDVGGPSPVIPGHWAVGGSRARGRGPEFGQLVIQFPFVRLYGRLGLRVGGGRGWRDDSTWPQTRDPGARSRPPSTTPLAWSGGGGRVCMVGIFFSDQCFA